LLEFWASWCGPCRYENPVLVKTYEEYHPKGLEILAVSIDTNKESWKQAILKDKLTWPNVSELNGFYGKAVSAYHVRGIPQNFLIGPDGTIVAINLRGEKLSAKLRSLLGK
jgi:thiol-disulfide isomerase/thioredoxin